MLSWQSEGLWQQRIPTKQRQFNHFEQYDLKIKQKLYANN